MSKMLTVIVNGEARDVPNDIETLGEFLAAVGYDDREFDVHRIDRGEEVKINGPMFVFDEGDEFVLTPTYVGDA